MAVFVSSCVDAGGSGGGGGHCNTALGPPSNQGGRGGGGATRDGGILLLAHTALLPATPLIPPLSIWFAGEFARVGPASAARCTKEESFRRSVSVGLPGVRAG